MNAFESKNWGIVISGADSVFACKNFEHAVEKCAELNRFAEKVVKPFCINENYPICWAKIEIWEDISKGSHDPENTCWDDPFAG